MSAIQKSKHKYYNKNKKFTKPGLDVNLKGFLCSCNNREKECVREAYNLLNKYADMVFPPEPQKEQAEENLEMSIEDELKKELSQIKSVKRFQQIESGAKNFLFIKTILDDPVKLAQTIVSELKSDGSQQSRFLIRLVPIEVTCKAYVKDITVAFMPLAEKYFKDNPTTFSVVYNHRNNNSVNRDEVIQAVAEQVFQVNSNNKVDLKIPNISIVIEVIKGIALIGVVPDFIKYKKYNLLLITEKDSDKGEGVDLPSGSETQDTK